MYKLYVLIACYFITAIIMISIGIIQMKKDTPVSLYIDEIDLKVDQVTDVKKWNKYHGMMYMIWSLVLIPFWTIGFLLRNSIWAMVPFLGGILIPFFIMSKIHKKMLLKYKK